jgi:hypothetical protein
MLKNEFKDMTLPREKLYGIYRGVVEDNRSDPEKAGRCKIRIFGIHSKSRVLDANKMDGIPIEDLPWAEPACPIFGGVSKIGIFGIPTQGSHVFVFFENGHILQPRYFATAPGLPRDPSPSDPVNTAIGFNDPDGAYPNYENLNSPDWNQGKNSGSSYPNSFVISDRNGNRIELDSSQAGTIVIEHGTSGSNITFASDGSIIISGSPVKIRTSSQETSITGDSNMRISGDNNTTSNNSNLHCKGNHTSMIIKGKSETVLGVCDLNAEENRINATNDYSCVAGGNVDIVCAKIATLKSKQSDVEIETTIGNIKSTALVGSISHIATLAFDAKSVLTTTKGVLNTVEGYAVTRLTAPIIMIG